jgi:glycosyltransferase involved in cell wall biosynthesis
MFSALFRGEGWGRPHVEAMAMGLPIIATNWCGAVDMNVSGLPLSLAVLAAVCNLCLPHHPEH